MPNNRFSGVIFSKGVMSVLDTTITLQRLKQRGYESSCNSNKKLFDKSISGLKVIGSVQRMFDCSVFSRNETLDVVCSTIFCRLVFVLILQVLLPSLQVLCPFHQ